MEAEYYFLTGDYSRAITFYESLLSEDPGNANLNFLCGFCYLKTEGSTARAIDNLEKAVRLADPAYKEGSYKERNAPMESYFLLARAHHINNNFDKAIEFYLQYSNSIDKRKFANIEYVNTHIKACELGKSMIDNPINIALNPLGDEISAEYDVCNPVVSGNDSIMIYLAERPISVGIMMSVKEENRWSAPRAINHEIGLTGNTFPVSLSFDGTELYLVYSDYFNTDIYVSHFRGKRWSRAVELNSINTKYMESHACVSQDGGSLFFTSDRKGGQGGLDIYRSERISGDEWGEPVNLGPQVNSYYNEESPFLTRQDQKLYFSSQGHNTMGGYDIFYSDKTGRESWSTPVNLGYPLNTSDDDLFYNPGWNDALAYYAVKPDSLSSHKNIFNVRIIPFDNLSIGVKNLKDDKVVEEAPGTHPGGSEEQPKVSFSSLGIYYILNNILFDFDDFILNDEAQRTVERIVSLMFKFPEIGLDLTGHTDAKGSTEYNIQLSNKRAQSVATYLIEKGIDPGRINVKAAGEIDPVAINEYEDGSDAPDGRKLNRHVSVKITNLNSDKIRVTDIFVPDDLVPMEDQGYSVLLLQSDVRRDNTPKEFLNEQVTMIATDESYLYSAGHFKQKPEAVKYLNEAIDQGYPDARMIEKNDFDILIQDNLTTSSYETLFYTIQFVALRSPKDIAYFSDLPKVKRYDGKDGLSRYVTGHFEHIDEAVQELPNVRNMGYKDAFVMPTSRYDALSNR